MKSSPTGTRIRNNRKSMSNFTINKLLLPTNIRLPDNHYNSRSQQFQDSHIEDNAFFIPKQSLRRQKHSEQNILISSTSGKSLQSQLLSKFLQENIQLHKKNSRKQIVIKEIVSPAQPYVHQRKETILNTEPSQEIPQQPFMPLIKPQSGDQYKFTFYSPKTQDIKQRLPKEFQILPCSKRRYFI